MTVSWMYQRDEVEITVQPKEESRPDIDQYAITCNGIEKLMTTLQLLDTQGFERVIIFCNTKHMCQRLCDDMQGRSYSVDCLHGDIRQSQREKVMQKFRDGKLNVLVATDVASGASMWMTWNASSTTISPRKTNIIFTGLAVPAGPDGRALPIHWWDRCWKSPSWMRSQNIRTLP